MVSPSDAILDPKGMAKRLRAALAEHGSSVTHAQCLELVARQFGERDWNTFVARSGAVGAGALESIPIVRVFDTERARGFYCDYLGFQHDWEHRFGPHHPLYTQVSLGSAKLHLSEHHGDASPGAAVLVTVRDVRAVHATLQSVPQAPGSLSPAVESEEWGLTLTVIDPFHNRIVFHQPHPREPARVAGLPGPIRYRLQVPCSPLAAFDAFAVRMGEWWHRDYSRDPERFAGVRVEPEVGGEVAMRFRDGTEDVWGEVLVWEPGELYRQRFWLAHDRAHPSEISVRFTAEAGGCRVDFEHGGWNAGNASERDRFDDWPRLLDGFVRLVST